MLTLAALEEFCDAVGVTTVLHPAVRRAVGAAEREFCAAAAGYLRGRTGDTFALPLAGGGDAALVFSRRLSPSGVGILRIDPADPDAMARLRRSLREDGFPAGDGRDPARPRSSLR